MLTSICGGRMMANRAALTVRLQTIPVRLIITITAKAVALSLICLSVSVAAKQRLAGPSPQVRSPIESTANNTSPSRRGTRYLHLPCGHKNGRTDDALPAAERLVRAHRRHRSCEKHEKVGMRIENGDVALCPHFQYIFSMSGIENGDTGLRPH